MERRQLSPMQWVLLSIAGSALAASVWFLSFAPVPRVQSDGCGLWRWIWLNRVRIVVFTLPFAGGFSLCLWAEKQIKRASRQGAWTEAELAPVRRFLSNPAWVAVNWAIIACALGMVVLGGHTDRGLYFYLLLIPSQTAQRLRSLIKPKVAGSAGLAGWRHLKPLHSEHWGERQV